MCHNNEHLDAIQAAAGRAAIIAFAVILLLAAGAWGGDNKITGEDVHIKTNNITEVFVEGKKFKIILFAADNETTTVVNNNSYGRVIVYLFQQIDSLRAEVDSLKNKPGSVFYIEPGERRHGVPAFIEDDCDSNYILAPYRQSDSKKTLRGK